MKFLFLILSFFSLHSGAVLAEEKILKPTVTVYIDGKDPNHLSEIITNATRLSKTVPLRKVVTVQKMSSLYSKDSTELNNMQANFIAITSPLKSSGLDEISHNADLSILEKIRVSYSPTWIVLYEGSKYIFEGYLSLDNFFTKDGLFKAETTADGEEYAEHKRKASSVNFPNTLSIKAGDTDFIVGTEFTYGEKDPNPGIDDLADTYHRIPKCKESKTELDEVFHYTEGSDALDLLIYDPRFTEDEKKAADSKIALAPWDPLYDASAGHETVDAKLQDLARVLNPACLPARFKFVFKGSKRYQQIDYGDKAWE